MFEARTKEHAFLLRCNNWFSEQYNSQKHESAFHLPLQGTQFPWWCWNGIRNGYGIVTYYLIPILYVLVFYVLTSPPNHGCSSCHSNAKMVPNIKSAVSYTYNAVSIYPYCILRQFYSSTSGPRITVFNFRSDQYQT